MSSLEHCYRCSALIGENIDECSICEAYALGRSHERSRCERIALDKADQSVTAEEVANAIATPMPMGEAHAAAAKADANQCPYHHPHGGRCIGARGHKGEHFPRPPWIDHVFVPRRFSQSLLKRDDNTEVCGFPGCDKTRETHEAGDAQR